MTGQHRRNGSSSRRGLVAALAVVLVAVVGVGAWLALGSGPSAKASSCGASTTLAVAAAPEIAPALGAVANQWNAAKTVVDGVCVRVAVSAAQPSDVTAAVAAGSDATVTGLGKPNGTQTVPDVWVPDSSLWLSRLGLASDKIALTGTSIAQSPVVIAVPQAVAAELTSKLKSLNWQALLGQLTSGTIRVGIVDPNVDASGLSAVLAVGQIATGGAGEAALATPGSTNPQAEASLVGAIRALAGGDSMVRDDLMGQFPRATDAATVARSLGAAPVTEQAVLAFDAAKPPVPLVALYLDPAPTALDYPYTVLPDLSGAKADAAREFQAKLAGDAWKNDLAAADLRAADGTYGAAMPKLLGMPAGPLKTSAIPAAEIDAALSTWSAVTVPGRMLAIIDVSGSMVASVPSAKNESREQVTVTAAQTGLGLFDDRWEVGLWTFSTYMVGNKPYKQLVPIGPLSANRGAMQTALSGVQPIPQGDTGLYDTVLAAYKAVQAGWDPSRVNSVVIMTDGQNDFPAGITMSTLLSKINAIKDPNKPVEVIIIGIGNEVNKAELTKITNATGGGVFIAADPSTIGQIFLQAIALRPGADK